MRYTVNPHLASRDLRGRNPLPQSSGGQRGGCAYLHAFVCGVSDDAFFTRLPAPPEEGCKDRPGLLNNGRFREYHFIDLRMTKDISVEFVLNFGLYLVLTDRADVFLLGFISKDRTNRFGNQRQLGDIRVCIG